MISRFLCKRIRYYALIFLGTSCSTYNKFSNNNSFTNEGQFIRFSNDTLNIENLTYGGLTIIDSKEKEEEYSSLKLKYHDIVYFANMDMGYTEGNVEYDYYILSKPNRLDRNHGILKTIVCNYKKYYLVISKKMPDSDRPLLINSFKCIK